MEIERKFLVGNPPENFTSFPCRRIEQGYLNTEPVIRIRKDNNRYELTYKSKGLMSREEVNLPLTKEAYLHLLTKIDGRLIKKRRYMLPLENGLTVELDIFDGALAPLMLAEVEFPDEETAHSFLPPKWLGKDVTFSGEYHNSRLSQI